MTRCAKCGCPHVEKDGVTGCLTCCRPECCGPMFALKDVTLDDGQESVLWMCSGCGSKREMVFLAQRWGWVGTGGRYHKEDRTMGCAVALIGQKLDRRRLFRKVEKRGCGCEVELQEGANYCSRCGKAAMVETEEPIDGFSDNGEPLAVECWEPLNGGKVKFYKPRSDGSWGNVVFAYSWMAKDIPGAGFSIIPILGNLFKTTTDTTLRTELIVLITPRVVRDRTEAREVTEELRRRMPSLAPLERKIKLSQ